MSRLVTQLVTDEPEIVLLGENTSLKSFLADALSSKNVDVNLIDINELDSKINLLNSAYKVLWIANQDKNPEKYIPLLQKLSEIKSQLIVVLPVFTGINSCSSNLLKEWVEDTKKQLQFIVDCNYYLQSASFIFGQNIIFENIDLSIFNYILMASKNNVLVDIISSFDFISPEDFAENATDLIFNPKKQISYLVKGKKTNSTAFISLVKKLYDAYHNTSLEIIQDKVGLSEVIPFSVSEKSISADERSIATYLVKNMDAPKKEINEKEILPTPFVEEKREIAEKQLIPEQKIDTDRSLHQKINSIILEEPKKEVVVIKEKTPVINPKQEQTEKNYQKTKDEEVDLNKEIQKIFKDTRKDEKVKRVEKIVESTKTIKKKSKRKTKLFYGGLLAIGMAVGMIVLATTYYLSGSILKKQVVSYLIDSSEKSIISKPGMGLLKTTDFVESQTNLYGEILELNIISKNSVLVDLINQLELIPEILDQADQASKNLVLNILNGSIGNTSELTENLTQKVSEAYEKLSLIQASLGQIDLGEFSQQQQNVVDQIGDKIQNFRSGLEIHQQLQQVLPDLVGYTDKRTYALLLQNNQELRPTGGFIQAVALVNFDNGSLVSYQVYSVYDLDKKLPGKVIPPDEIKEHLGEENWFLRDSNWDPDFSKTSKQVEWFIEKSLGVEVDGVIGMNVFSLADLIKAVGPINLPEYNEVINERNIEERMEFHSEVVLIDSPESIDYSVKILTETLNSLSNLKEDKVSTLLEGLRNSLDTKQIQVYSDEESEQSIIGTLGWAGSTNPPDCPSRLSVVDCVVDNFAQVEANIGVNKANYYLDRRSSHKIKLSRDLATHTRTVVFDNKAQSNSWPKGTYKSFIRFYVNNNSSLEKVMINGNEIDNRQVIISQEDKYKVFAVRVDVPIQKQLSLDLVYSTPLQKYGDFSYVFYNNKQSGLGDDPFNVEITFDPIIKPVLVAPNATISGNTISFSAQSLDEASLFGVKFE